MKPARTALIERFTELLNQAPPKGVSSVRLQKEVDYAE